MAKFGDFFFSIKKHDLVVAAVVGAVAGLSVPGSAHQRVSKEELFCFKLDMPSCTLMMKMMI